MINILPTTLRQELQAAHTNTTLLKYILVLMAGVAFLSTICVAVYFILIDTKSSAEATITQNQQRSSSYSNAQTQAETLKASLTKAKGILENEFRYSKLMTSMAKLMPSGTVLDGLNLNESIIGAPTTMTIYAKSTAGALKLKDNFQSSGLFSNVSFQSISENGATGYPVTATMNLVINKVAAK